MKSKMGATLMLVSIFLLGCVSGGVSYYLYRNHFTPAPAQHTPGTARRDIVEEMSQSLHLDAQQQQQLAAIIQQSRQRYSALSQQFRPQYEQIRSETDQAIRAILRPDQRQLFEETLEKMEARRRSRPHDQGAGPAK